MRVQSSRLNDSRRRRLLGLVMVIVGSPTLAAGCLGMVEDLEEVPPPKSVLPAQVGTPAASTATQSPIALRVDTEIVTERQLNYELEQQLEAKPSMGRRAACDRAVDIMIEMVLINIDRVRSKGSVTDATMTAAASGHATFIAEIPPEAATELAQRGGVIPTIEPYFLEMALELVAHEDKTRAGAETPSPEEIAEAMKDDSLGVPRETAEARAKEALLADRQDAAQKDYLNQLREQANIEVLVDCATF